MELNNLAMDLLELMLRMEEDGFYFCERDDGMMGVIRIDEDEPCAMLCHRSHPISELVSEYDAFKRFAAANAQPE